jgi:AraC family L-rhamnose operon transcriptional activator RhaR
MRSGRAGFQTAFGTADGSDRPPVINRLCFARDLHGHLSAPIWLNHYMHGSQIALHEHDFLEIVLVTKGAAEHRTVQGSEPLSTGDLVIIHPGQWHGYDAPEAMWIRNCCLSGELFSRELAWVHDDPRLAPLFPARMPRDDDERRAAPQGVRVLHFSGEALRRVHEAYDGLQALCDSGEAKDRRGVLVARALLLLEAIAAHGDFAATTQSGDGRVAAATTLMAETPAHPWSLAELAGRTGSSASHLLRLFRHDTGLAPIAWLARLRAERLAVLLLTSEKSVAELGPAVGWDDPSYCARRFRARFGVAPDAYRRRHRVTLPADALPRQPASQHAASDAKHPRGAETRSAHRSHTASQKRAR